MLVDLPSWVTRWVWERYILIFPTADVETLETLSFMYVNNQRILREHRKEIGKTRFVNMVVRYTLYQIILGDLLEMFRSLFGEFANLHSPVQLASNWVHECTKFFHHTQLRAKLWTPADWYADTRLETVWIVKESLINAKTNFAKAINGYDDFTLVSLFADEAHKAWRSFSSARGVIFRDLMMRARMHVLITGTPFPLGPSTDAREVLEHSGGPIGIEVPENETRWPYKLRLAFSKLLHPRSQEWNTLAFRVLIAPYMLRRTGVSTWDKKFVIEPSVRRPVPWVVPPYADAFTDDTQGRLKHLSTMLKKVKNLAETIDRVDKMRFIAWAPEVYAHCLELLSEKRLTQQQIFEQTLVHHFPDHDGSGRVRRLVALLKRIRQRGERFIIVSDRLFLVTLATYVCSCNVTLTDSSPKGL